MPKANTRAFKRVKRQERIQQTEEVFQLGMNYTDVPLLQGAVKELINLDISDDGQALKPRPSLKARYNIKRWVDPKMAYYAPNTHVGGTTPLNEHESFVILTHSPTYWWGMYTGKPDWDKILQQSYTLKGSSSCNLKPMVINHTTGEMTKGEQHRAARHVNHANMETGPNNLTPYEDCRTSDTKTMEYIKSFRALDIMGSSIHGMRCDDASNIVRPCGTYAYNKDYFIFTNRLHNEKVQPPNLCRNFILYMQRLETETLTVYCTNGKTLESQIDLSKYEMLHPNNAKFRHLGFRLQGYMQHTFRHPTLGDYTVQLPKVHIKGVGVVGIYADCTSTVTGATIQDVINNFGNIQGSYFDYASSMTSGYATSCNFMYDGGFEDDVLVKVTPEDIYKVEPRQLTPNEAVKWGYNMLAQDPYNFVCSNMSAVMVFTGCLPFDNGKICLTPEMNKEYTMRMFYAAPVGIKYTIKVQWKDIAGTVWDTICESEFDVTGTPEPFEFKFTFPCEKPLFKITAERYVDPIENTKIRYVKAKALGAIDLPTNVHFIELKVNNAAGTNVALNKTAYVENDKSLTCPGLVNGSTADSDYKLANMEDNNSQYRARVVDLGSIMEVDNIQLWLHSIHTYYHTTIDVSKDGETWYRASYTNKEKSQGTTVKMKDVIWDKPLPESAVTFGYDISKQEQGSMQKIELKNYDISKNKGMCYWNNRLVVYGVDSAPTQLFMSEINMPEYFPYPNCADIFDEEIKYCVPFQQDLLVFTSTQLWRIKPNVENLSWNKQLLQQNLSIIDWDIHLIQVVKGMVYFKSGNYYYMVVPKAGVNGELTIAPISKPIEKLLDDFKKNMEKQINVVYNKIKTVDWKLIHYYNFVDKDDIVNVYTFGKWSLTEDVFSNPGVPGKPPAVINDSTLFSYMLIYNTVQRNWRIYMVESAGLMEPIRYNITEKCKLGMYNYNYLDCKNYKARAFSLLEWDYSDCEDVCYYSSKYQVSTIDNYRSSFFQKPMQYLDTGYREHNSDWKKRYRELQFKINNTSQKQLKFNLDFVVDSEVRKSSITYEAVYNPEEGKVHYVPTYADPYIVPSNTLLSDVNNTEEEQRKFWTLDSSRFPDTAIWKVRVPVTGKGYAPRIKMLMSNGTIFELLNLGFVYRMMNAR